MHMYTITKTHTLTDIMSSDEEFEQFDYDEYVGTGAMQSTIGDSDTTILFRDLQHELEALVQNYHVPLVELEQLFQVSYV